MDESSDGKEGGATCSAKRHYGAQITGDVGHAKRLSGAQTRQNLRGHLTHKDGGRVQMVIAGERQDMTCLQTNRL